MTAYQANTYPSGGSNPTVTNADTDRKSMGVCFSGGGSRALTCAWGQLIGLNTLRATDGKRLLDQVRYLSSVSGGSWASVLYTFRPGSIPDSVFLGPYYDPAHLYYGSNLPGCLNVSTMNAQCLGKVPQNFSNLMNLDISSNIITEFIVIALLSGVRLKDAVQWLWMYIVGKNVLASFGLYSYNYYPFSKNLPWNYTDAKFFSLSSAYAQKNIFNGVQAPPAKAFTYARTDASGKPSSPMLVVNTNIVGKNCPGAHMSAPMQIPLQVSAVAAGIYGANPCAAEDAVGGGLTETFSFSSTLASVVGPTRVSADFPRTYSLADITSCSSAFFAAYLAKPISMVLDNLQAMDDEPLRELVTQLSSATTSLNLADIRGHLEELQQEALLPNADDLVPKYNYWPVSQTVSNTSTQFTDGGSMDNTGVAGLLAQARGALRNLISFVNGVDTPAKVGGQIVAATQMAPLFGVAYDGKSAFKNYAANGINPFTGKTDPIGFLQVFSNSNGEFAALQQGLYAAANNGGSNANPVFYLQTLKVINNTLLGIAGWVNTINVLWVQNTRVNSWQNQIKDPELLERILLGQTVGDLDEMVEFARFPYYDTFWKIHQTAAETNTLAQMWAWCVSDPASPLSAAIQKFFAAAEK